jgi:hypothetical protein
MNLFVNNQLPDSARLIGKVILYPTQGLKPNFPAFSGIIRREIHPLRKADLRSDGFKREYGPWIIGDG